MKEETLFEFVYCNKQKKVRLNRQPKNLPFFVVRPKEPGRTKKIQFGRYILEFFDKEVEKKIAFDALNAMMEQDAFINQQKKSAPKVIMSIETYEHIQKNPESYEEIRNRMIKQNNDTLKEVNDFLKKW